MTTILILEHAESRANEFERIATAVGATVVTNRIYQEPVIKRLSAFDAVISTGGPMSVTQRHKSELRFLLDEIELLQIAHADGIPVLGVCLGHQLLTVALGGEVEELRQGPEIGWCELRLTPDGEDDPIFRGLPKRFGAFQYHYDGAVELPSGCLHIASSDHLPIQGIRVSGSPVWGVQFHPEVPPALAFNILIDRASEIRAQINDFDMKMEEFQERLINGLHNSAEIVITNFISLVNNRLLFGASVEGSANYSVGGAGGGS